MTSPGETARCCPCTTTRAPRAFKKRGAFGDDDDGDAESDRIKTLKESFVGSHGRIHKITLVYVQQDINESFANSEHAAVALMWSGPAASARSPSKKD